MGYTFVISGLTAKRAELSGEIGEVEKRLDRLRADLDSLDATIRLFDPTAKPSTTKPRVKRRAKQQFRTGELTRVSLSVQRRAERPMNVREIATDVAAECGLDMGTVAAANVVVANVRAALARLAASNHSAFAQQGGQYPSGRISAKLL
jgi:hypothetical protein